MVGGAKPKNYKIIKIILCCFDVFTTANGGGHGLLPLYGALI